jgi:hypothetical protein
MGLRLANGKVLDDGNIASLTFNREIMGGTI